METLRLNVGGTVFETTRETLRALPDWKLSEEQSLQSHYRESQNDYFFDRDPVIFGALLNYLRTSQLHLPSIRCGPSIKTELEYWKVDPKDIQRCCWTNYNKWNSTLDALARLDRDRKAFSNGLAGPESKSNDTFWARHRARVWQFLNRSNSSAGAKIFGIVSLVFVVVSITTLVVSTTNYFESPQESDTNATTKRPTTNVPANTVLCTTAATNEITNTEKYHKNEYLETIDIICLIFFLLEYAIRLIYSPRKLHSLVSFLSIIDVIALVPDIIEYVVFTINPDVESSLDAISFVTILRVFRIFRIFRLVRHSTGLWVLIYTLKASIRELLLLVWLILIGIVFFASLIYVAEDKKDFNSIPDGFWWAIITMTTVGYGDMSPKTALGKVIGAFCAMLGVLVIGFSVPSLVNNFMLYYSQIEFASMMEEREKLEKINPEEKDINQSNDKVTFDELTTQL